MSFRRRMFFAFFASVAAHLLLLLVPMGWGPGEPGALPKYPPALELLPVEPPSEEAPPMEVIEDDESRDDGEATGGIPSSSSSASRSPRGSGRASQGLDREERSDLEREPRERKRAVDERERLSPPDARESEQAGPALDHGGLESSPVVDLFPPSVLAEMGPSPTPDEFPRPSNDGETVRSLPTPDARERKELANRRIAAYVRDEKARHRVESGLVDPYFVRLRESFEEGFAPQWRHFDARGGEGLLGDLSAWLTDYAGSMERYAESGSPYHAGESSSGTGHLSAPLLPGSGTIAKSDSRMDMAQSAAMQTLLLDMARGKAAGVDLTAVLRVIQTQSGVLMRIDIERSSGRGDYDELARETIRRALTRAQPPERAGQGLGLREEKIESLWAFRTRFVVVPPFPMTACEFDLDGSGGECTSPLQRRVLPRVELEAVY